jgi:arylsulfatase A-like enzyme
VGNLTAHMKSLDLWENTIMIAASDNGTFVVRKNTMVVCVSHSSVVKIDPK